MVALIITIGIILLIIGYVSCILPPLPGPPVAFLALVLIYYFLEQSTISGISLIILGVISILVTIMDNFVAIWGTHKFGGTKAGVRGSVIGMLVGIFVLTPFIGFLSVIVGPLLGATIGELIAGNNFDTALKSGLGSFIGFLLGLGLKLITTSVIAFYFFKSII
ncbi:MAG: DUF456 domain-containing protein [Chitinophagales bacterium]|nr:DUF456 domain-containing protein [Chitinophagales bacterium]